MLCPRAKQEPGFAKTIPAAAAAPPPLYQGCCLITLHFRLQHSPAGNGLTENIRIFTSCCFLIKKTIAIAVGAAKIIIWLLTILIVSIVVGKADAFYGRWKLDTGQKAGKGQSSQKGHGLLRRDHICFFAQCVLGFCKVEQLLINIREHIVYKVSCMRACTIFMVEAARPLLFLRYCSFSQRPLLTVDKRKRVGLYTARTARRFRGML
jgi:hypothetical protein